MVLGHGSGEAVARDRAFRELGFDSLTAVELRNRLAGVSGLSLPASLVFDYPTPEVLAAFLLAEVGLGGEDTGLESAVADRIVATGGSATADDPIVIVAMSCRLPGGVRSPEELWQLVSEGVDAVSEFPVDRGWDVGALYNPDPESQGTSYSRFGGFLHDAGDFDPGFFGISPREALAMDPQQRLLLETSWEAFERAGIDPNALRGSRTGVFVGSNTQDYGALLMGAAQDVEGYLATGNSASVVSGRLAYTFGLEGPAVTIDTACSSSLVALHWAAQALRNGECTLALAGGALVMATPGTFVEFSRQRGLSEDGRCKAFAGAADGTGWGEGVSLLLLERLSDARANGHPVLAVVAGSAVNQDGASNGLTAPNGPAQQRVIRQALADAGLTTADVDLVEAHGTGTRLGDPIEAQALLATYGQDRPEDRPLWLGSLKSNIGHTQAASGVAGVVKAVLAIQHGLMPRTLHVDEPTPQVDWSAGRVELLTEARDWPELGDGRPRRAAVSSFGMSGTNAHVVIEQIEPAETPAESDDTRSGDQSPALGLIPWVLSGRDDAALRDQARRLLARVGDGSVLRPADVAGSLATGRAALSRRAVVVGATGADLVDALQSLVRGESFAGLTTGAVVDGKSAFLFTGQGSQRLGMGRGLYDTFPVFAAAFDEVCAHCDTLLERPLAQVVFEAEDASLLDQTAYAQPALFAIEVAVFRLLESWGVRPDVLVGHSIGEIAAAHVAGVLSLEDACTLVAARGRLMQALPVGGVMVAVQASEDEVLPLLKKGVDIAAVNGPTSVVISGSKTAVTSVASKLSKSGRKTKKLTVSHAFHSSLMEPMLVEFRSILNSLTWNEPQIPVVSNVSGSLAGVEFSTPEYWVNHVRAAVRFADGIVAAYEFGARTFLELGPDGVLTAMAQDCLTAGVEDLAFAPTIRAGRDEAATVLAAVATAWTHGQHVDWTVFAPGAARVDLPTYAFQHERYWPTLAAPAKALPAGAAARSEGEQQFWESIEREDLGAFAEALSVGQDESLSGVVSALSSWRRRDRDRSVVDGWRYRVAWKPLPANDFSASALSGGWAVVVPAGRGGAVAEAVIGMLGSRTAGVEIVDVDLDTLDRAALAERLAELGEIAGVVSLLALADEAQRAAIPSVILAQALGDAGVGGSVWLLTSGAVSVGRSDRTVVPEQGLVWGLGRVFGLEHPERWGGLVDLPEVLDARALGRLAGVFASGAEDQVAVRDSGVFARRIEHAGALVGGGWSPRGTVLVTGGTGALGGRLALWAAAQGAEHLVLTSRSGPGAPGAQDLADQITALGARVDVVACDVADRTAVEELLAAYPVNAVVHAAGVDRGEVIDLADVAEFAAVLAAKVDGARNLNAVLGDAPLDAFVLFSSISGVWGSGGQGAYSAANAYLDALAESRRARGLAATAIAWGPWADGGMASVGGAAEHLARRGLAALDPDRALEVLARLVGSDAAASVVADVDWARFAPAFAAARTRPLIGDLPEVIEALSGAQAAADAAGRSAAASTLTDTLAALPPSEREQALVELVRTEAAAVLGHARIDAVEPRKAFRELGFDSLTAVELRQRLARATGLTLPATIVFDYPNPTVLAAHLATLAFGSADGALSQGSATTPGAGAAVNDDPIAIVAMSVRLPGGVRSPEDLWRLVSEGVDAVSEFPVDRGWDVEALYNPDPESQGTSYSKHGGFLHDAGDFDPGFFGISPREALAMDPQQRLLLETSWEAFERAGIDPNALRGSRTGVFVGSNTQDYGALLMGAAQDVEGYVATGNSASVVSGRLSYTFGLEGPAVTIDTACSSSLVALHWAAQALRNGECTLALAGGALIMATPGTFVEFSRQRGLSEDGRCKAFAAAADGTGWGEGVSLLLLERLSDARANGHPVLAVVAGSAVNQDGASNGLTAPNGPAQQRVIRQALADAGLTTADVDLVEAHGTGTRLGDPIEAQALLATYGQDRPEDRPVWLGSLKSNIGHTQAASGVAGVVKAVLAIQHGLMPRTLHVDAPTPHVDWTAGRVELLTEARPWTDTDGRPRRAGVSSFGMSGTNAHAVIEQAPAYDPAETATGSEPAPTGTDQTEAESQTAAIAWPLSAHTPAALREQAQRLLAFASTSPETTAAEIAHALATTRAGFDHRATVIGADRAELTAALAAFARGEEPENVVTGTVASGAGRTVFVFPGQGAQWVGMALDLAEQSEVFRARMDECAQELVGLTDWSLWDVLADADALDRSDVVQPVLFAIMVSLAELWRSYGVEPAAVVGHSQGEIAAACVAGALTLPVALRMVVERSRLLLSLSGGGAMASVTLPQAEAEQLLARWPGRLSIGVVNGPRAVVASGDVEAVIELIAHCEAEGIRARRVPIDYASHSPHVEQIQDELLRAFGDVRPAQSPIAFYSSVTGVRAETTELDADYWYRNLRQTVEFGQATEALLAAGYGRFVECSPRAVLAMGLQQTLDDAADRQAGPESEVLVVGSLTRGEGGLRRFLGSVAVAHAHGAPVDWSRAATAAAAETRPAARTLALPTYPFQRQRYWPTLSGAALGDVTSAGLTAPTHPLLGAAVLLADGEGMLFTGRLSAQTQPWLADHAIGGAILLPGTAFVELAVRAGDQAGCDRVEDLTLEVPLVLPDRGAVAIQVHLAAADEAGNRRIAIYSRSQDASFEDPWTRHASGSLTSAATARSATPQPLTQWPPAEATAVPVEDFYPRLSAGGYGYGPAFQGLRSVWTRGEETFAEVRLPSELRTDGARYGLHPALLDAALHALGLGGLVDQGAGVQLPFAWSGVSLLTSGATGLRVRLAPAGHGAIAVTLADEAGTPVAFVEALTLRPVSAAALTADATVHDKLFRLDWTALGIEDTDPSALGRCAVVGPDTHGLAAALAAAGLAVTAATDLAQLTEVARQSADDGQDAPAPNTVFLALTGPADPIDPTNDQDAEPVDTVAAVHAVTAEALATVQAWLAEPLFDDARLVFVTRGAVSVRTGQDVPALDRAAVWGLIRTAQSENPERFHLLDLDGPAPDQLAAAMATGEPQLALRDGVAHAPRLARVSTSPTLIPPPATPAWRLDTTAEGTLENLTLVPCPQELRPLAGHEVRLALRASGLNFRDVVLALGMVPDQQVMGNEGAGVVLEVGADVRTVRPGDRVFGLASGTFAPIVVVDHRLVAPIPAGWSFTEAATVAVVFLTAYYGLVDLGRVGPGDRVLVHSAAGGVGMAAVQIARHLGAEVFGTASPGKWDALRALGLDDEHIANSRTLDFEAEFRAATGGRGLDMVLDSLAREFVDASLRLLGPGGRFIEMGKTDKRDPAVVAADHPGVYYQAFDLIEAGPERVAEMLTEVIALFDRDVLELLPIMPWDLRRAPEAFRFLSQARHVGKLVLNLPRQLDPDGTVLITGGAGALARVIARHLVTERGITSLILAGRRGGATPETAELIADLSALGATVTAPVCDVADRAQVDALIAAVPAGRPLTAVVHTAGILDDGLLTAMSPERLAAVLRPKVDAAWNLHEATRHLDLAAFVLFSAAAGTFGGAGQGNYAAANVFLDALAHHRRAAGLPALALAWGFWADRTGLTSHLDAADVDRMARSGMGALASADGAALFDAALTVDEALLMPAELDLAVMRAQVGPAGPAPLLRGLIHNVTRRAAAAGVGEGAEAPTQLAAKLAALPAEQRGPALIDLVRTHVAIVLGHQGADEIPADRPFKELGFDSLTAVELRNRLRAATGERLPATLVFDYPSPAVLAEFLLGEILGRDLPAPLPAAAAAGARTGGGAGAEDEPIAIIAMGCRYPGGVATPEDLWQLVADGGDAITAFPADRGWDTSALFDADPAASGTSYVREGGFLHDAARFDAGFFGISPREALAMDPQQRLLLETSLETFERAGIAPEKLRGSQTAVYVGAAYHGYTAGPQEMQELEGHLLTGASTSIMSGRIAYTFGLEGPAVTVDTACSSSLVAMHLAAQSLRHGECTLALAGGVAVMATPGMFVEFSRQQGLSFDGRCKAFAAAADGTGWAEGAGMLLLERLSDAERNGHTVLAVIRGSAVNQDGASNGLTAPNGPAQQRVIRQALANAGLNPGDVDAIEAHGTGTKLGDPIEAQAVIATYGQDRPEDRPLYLGSLKSNIGHSQAAAGVGGVIKMVMALRNGLLPRTLHVDAPTPHVDWADGAISLLTEARPWPQDPAHVRRAGVSSFGVSGTNAHLIVEQAPAPAAAPAPQDQTPAPDTAADPAHLPWVVTGRTEAALRDQAARLRAHTAEHRPAVADVAASLLDTRTAHDHRAVVVAADLDAFLAALDTLADGGRGPNTVTGVARSAGATAFLFTGQGSQRAGMGRELYAAYPVFAAAFDEACDHFRTHLDTDLKALVVDGSDLLDQTACAQPALFAIEVALFRLLESWGLRPDVLVGHSIGEISAAHAAGVLSLADAAALVAARGRLMQALPAGGTMVAVQATEEEVLPLLTEGVDIAAVNGPEALVVSGTEDAVTAVAAQLAGLGRKTKRLTVSHAFHSALMDPMLEDFRAVLATLDWHEPTIPVVSNVTGALAGAELSTPDYWVRHVRAAVRFADGVAAAYATGARTFVELGPDGVLTAMAQQTLDPDAVCVPTIRADRPEAQSALLALAQAYARGVPARLAAPVAAVPSHRVDLPTYAFQQQAYWPSAGPLPAGPAEAAPGETRFWDAIDRGDVDALLATVDGSADEDAQLWAPVLPALASFRRRQRDRAVLADSRYRVTWRPAADPSGAAAPTLDGTWLVVAARADELTEAAADALGSHGAATRTLIAPDPDGLREAIAAEQEANGAPFAGVLSLLADPGTAHQDTDSEPTTPGLPARGLTATLLLAQALSALDLKAPLWIATRGAVSVGRTDPSPDTDQAQVWGLGRVLALELPQLWGGLVDLPAALDRRSGRRLAALLATGTEDQVALRSSGGYLRRIERAAPARRAPWTPRGTVLITGGTGALGAHVARWLAAAGAERLVLTSRRGLDAPGAADLLAELAATGVAAEVRACDVADREAVAALLAEVKVDAVVHAAGVPQHLPAVGVGVPEFADVLSAKVAGAAHLDELLRDADLDAFVLFSSISAVWGSGGQCAYAAGNAYLDALAEQRRARGAVATSIAWGPWGGGGMAEGGAADQLRRRGLVPLDPPAALAALGQALASDEPTTVVAQVDWDSFVPGFTALRPRPLIGDLPEVRRLLEQAEVAAAASGAADGLRESLAGLSGAERLRAVLTLLRGETAAVLGYASAGEVGADIPFRELGFDSLTAVELRNRLAAATGLKLPATLVFDYPTLQVLAAHVGGLLGDEQNPQTSLLAELDRLESTVAALDRDQAEAGPGGPVREQVSARLAALLARLQGGQVTVRPAGAAAAFDPNAVGEASDDELFDLIDRKFAGS
ncbi:MAG TPA: SDR family NAD(P)-dependent oxidoreductase [Actinocrinis sp.]|nr:SDR family NAD(P)-dependent oxidoreductase [Actinocrinis sp.]